MNEDVPCHHTLSESRHESRDPFLGAVGIVLAGCQMLADTLKLVATRQRLEDGGQADLPTSGHVAVSGLRGARVAQ